MTSVSTDRPEARRSRTGLVKDRRDHSPHDRRACGRRLDAVLGAWLEARLGRKLSKSAVRRVIIAGTVREAASLSAGPGSLLRPGQALEVRVDPSKLEVPLGPAGPQLRRHGRPRSCSKTHRSSRWTSRRACPPCPPPIRARPSLVRAVEAYLAKSVAPRHLGVHQRLDRETSGVVLFVKDPRANAGLADSFAKHRIEKTYHALTAQPREPAAAAMALHPAHRHAERDHGVQPGRGARAAPSSWKRGRAPVASTRSAFTWRERGCRFWATRSTVPRSAPPGSASPRLMLHASRLALPHPLTGAPLVIESPWPEDFRRELEARRARATGLPLPGAALGRSRGLKAQRSLLNVGVAWTRCIDPDGPVLG